MNCAWKELLAILPAPLKVPVDRLGREGLQELRLRLNQPVELVMGSGSHWLEQWTSAQDISFVVNTASRYSPWSAATVSQGYITAPGGHRIGLAGEVVVREGQAAGVREVQSLCIRVARDFQGIGQRPAKLTGNILILGPPGSGKTTMLRDMIRFLSETDTVAVVDERGELFPMGFLRGKKMDVLTGCSKAHGVETALRTLGPACIAVDEITAEEDCRALIQAGWCGVRLIATAHGANRQDLRSRPIYRRLWDCGLFDSLVVMGRDKSWYTERMMVCP